MQPAGNDFPPEFPASVRTAIRYSAVYASNPISAIVYVGAVRGFEYAHAGILAKVYHRVLSDMYPVSIVASNYVTRNIGLRVTQNQNTIRSVAADRISDDTGARGVNYNNPATVVILDHIGTCSRVGVAVETDPSCGSLADQNPYSRVSLNCVTGKYGQCGLIYDYTIPRTVFD